MSPRPCRTVCPTRRTKMCVISSIELGVDHNFDCDRSSDILK